MPMSRLITAALLLLAAPSPSAKPDLPAVALVAG